MIKRHVNHATALATKMLELSVAAPHVIAHRTTRMALAGSRPADRDRKEFGRMVAEKQTAFLEASMAMAAQMLIANQSFALMMMRAFWSPVLGKRIQWPVTAFQGAALGVLAKGLAPIHRTARANSRRLARTKLL